MRVSVKVRPRSLCQKILREADGSLSVWLREPPADGKANKSLIGAISDYYNINKSCIAIVAGKKSRNKIIEIQGG